MNIRALTLAAGLTVAGSANAAFLGVDFVLDAGRTAAAQGTSAAGNDVFLMYAGFDDAADFLTGIVDVIMDAGGTLYQDGFGDNLPPNDSFFGLVPSLEFDTFVTIGALTASAADGGVGLDGNGVAFTATGLTGAQNGGAGWFSVPDTGLGTPVFNADLGFFTVVLAQFTVAQGTRANFTGDYNIGFNDATGANNIIRGSDFTGDANGFGFIPTPGAMALFGLAGLTAIRRRRA